MTVGQILLIILAVAAVLGIIGLWQKKRHPGKESGKEAIDKAMSNVADLNDRFNRARYQSEDDK